MDAADRWKCENPLFANTRHVSPLVVLEGWMKDFQTLPADDVRDRNYHSVESANSSARWLSRNENVASVLFHSPSLLDVITRKR